ncbi:protein tyrosine phosphatase-like protein [Phlyctema vagabunda]|uniref:Very-long-chain (3R)-3-hydroxyacyl-CoA dehydratase n=1 Tax=Phlyctema vagabunda TaxID=108571 RepID=A0ABR4PEA7_9HELO
MASPKANYLIIYNTIFTLLWLNLLVKIAVDHPVSSYDKTYDRVGEFAKWIQTAALLDVLHAAIGLVRAPLIPTFIQTVAKNLVLWTIVRPFPRITESPAYTALLITWSISETIRYSYFAMMLSGQMPRFMPWLRYSAFVLIYPVGISCEMWLVYRAIGESRNPSVMAIMWAELVLLYTPGSYFLYTYMLKQRKRSLGGSTTSVLRQQSQQRT